MIEEKQLEKAMNYLADTDREGAELKADVARTEFLAKVCEAMHYKAGEGSIEDRKQSARLAPEVKAAWEKHFQAITEYETVRAKRERAVLTVEVYRTESANRRRAA